MNALIKKTKIFSRMINPNHKFSNKFLLFNKIPLQFSITHIFSYQKFNFCDKPPKGFESFNRKRKILNPKEKTEKLHEKEEKLNPTEKTEKPEEKEEKSFQEKKDDEDEISNDKKQKDKKSDSEDNEENNKKKLEDDKKGGDDNKETLINGLLAAFCLFLGLSYLFEKGDKEITMSEFLNLVSTKKIKNIVITKDSESNTFYKVICHLNDNTRTYLTIINNDQFLSTLEIKQNEMGVSTSEYIPLKYNTNKETESNTNSNLLFFMIFSSILLYRVLKKPPKNMKNFSDLNKGKTENKSSGKSGPFGANFNIFDIVKSNVKEVGVEQKIKTKFKHVAGMEQAKKEIVEFVDFLKYPEKYHKLGAKIPRGALLVGPPGTGKTLLAKAVAGEASVPFFAISGSDFVEMFVGVGASRVRDLFKKAKEKAPSIVFIDEIDAVGRKRGGKFSGGHDERESTLNQLLVEMDGFSTDSNVIVLAATNRKDILDPALLRPGRFDRTVEINLPDRKDRQDILKIYLKKIKLDKSKSIDEYASRISTLTPGFSGADICKIIFYLANLVNEAAIISARDNLESVASLAFEKASERIIAGLETKRVLSEKERRTVAFHEAGHAVIGWFLEHSNPLVKVTIIPRSKGALGFTQYIPDDISLHTTEQLYDLMCVALGGRMAEEHFFGTITTGASDDLQRVTNIANSIVTKFGMSKLGLSTYTQNEEGFVKPYSNTTEAEIENEVKSIINHCADRTRLQIKEYKDKIERLANELLLKETLDLLDIINCLGERPFPLPDSIKDYLDEIKKRKEKKPDEVIIEEVIKTEEKVENDILVNEVNEETKEKK